MTPEQIRAAVSASPALLSLATQRDTATISMQLSVGRWRWAPTEIGKGTLLETLGLATGNALCDLIDNQADYRHVKHLLTDGRLRLDSALVRSTLEQLTVGGLLTVEERDRLLALAQQPDPVDERDVLLAIFNEDGTLRI